MIPNTNIKVVYDFYNQQPESTGDKLSSMANKNALQAKGNDPNKVKRSNVSTVNIKRTAPTSIKIESEILIEESERDNRFSRPSEKKPSATPNRQGSTSIGKNSGGALKTAGKSVNKQTIPAVKSKSPVRPVSPNTNVKKTTDLSKNLKSIKSPDRKSLKTDISYTVKEKLNESVNSSLLEGTKTSKVGLIRQSTSLKNLNSNKSETPVKRSEKNSTTPVNKLNRSFNVAAENSNARPKTPKPNPSKNSKITAINQISTNNINILSSRNSDNNENNQEPTKEFKNTKSVNNLIYNAPAKNTSKNLPVRINTSKKNVIEGTLADGEGIETSASTTPNKSRLDQFKEQNMFNNKNPNIFQVAKEEKDARQTKYGNNNTKKLNSETGETNNSYNIINKKKVDLKFITTSPLIRV